MCIIALQPAGAATMPEAQLRSMWAHNSDGAGYGFAHGGVVHLRKPYFRLRDLLTDYQKDHERYGKEAPFLLHMRWATHGGKTEMNTHPFLVGQGRALVAHNGVIRVNIPDKAMSDTLAFCRENLDHVRPGRIVGAKMRKGLAKRIGPGNKLAFINATGAYSIVNEAAGTWKDGTWYSNEYSLSEGFSRYSSVTDYYNRGTSCSFGRDWQIPETEDTDDLKVGDLTEDIYSMSEDFMPKWWNEYAPGLVEWEDETGRRWREVVDKDTNLIDVERVYT